VSWRPELLLECRTAYLWGKTGTGKTHAAAALYRTSPVKPLWLSAPDDVGRMVGAVMRGTAYRSYANGCGGQYVTRDDYLRWVSRCGLLILDDLGVGAITGGATTMPLEHQAALQAILDACGCYLIITSNIAPKDLGRMTNERIASRCLGGLRLEMAGPDRRLQNAKTGRVS
jgi:predicted ATPase